MATENDRPFVMTCDAVDAPVEDAPVNVTVPSEVKEDDEPLGDDAGEGEPTSQVTADAAPVPFDIRHSGKMVHIIRRIRVVPEKVEDEEKDALVKDEAVAMDRKPVALSAADCKAKNPLRCPYHGAAAMTEKFGEILKKHGLGGMKFSIMPFDEDDDEDTSYVLDFECPEEYADAEGMEALKEFGKLSGIVIDTEDTEGLIEKVEDGRREALFEVDFFDKDAEDPKKDVGGDAPIPESAETTAGEEPKTEPPKAEETPKTEPPPVVEPEVTPSPKAEEPPKVEEPPKAETAEPPKSSKDDFEEDTKPPKDEVPEESKHEAEEKPSTDIPKDPVERAMKAIEEFDGMVSGSRLRKIEEAKGSCDACAKDMGFLERAIKDAPNDRVKKMLSDKLSAVTKEMDVFQSELKHACGDAMMELKDAIGHKLDGRYECETKMDTGSGADVRKELDSLRKEAGLRSLSKVDGYKAMRDAEKEFDSVKSEYEKLLDDYDAASDADDYRRMSELGDKIHKQMEKCSAASDKLKTARENVKASLIKKAKDVRERLRASLPDKFKVWGLRPGESAADYMNRMKKMGLGDEIPETIKNMQKRIDSAEENMRNAYKYTEEQWKTIKDNLKKSWEYTMSVSSLGCNMDAETINLFFDSWLKSQHELGPKGTRIRDSHAHYVFTIGDENSCRYRLTRNFFGTKKGMDEKHYEKYGNLKDKKPHRGDFEAGRGYGENVIRFRSDSVVATVTGDDSLSAASHNDYRAPLVTDISPTFIWRRRNDLLKTLLTDSVRWDVNRWRQEQFSSYLELQFHGAERPRPEDVESINFSSESELKVLNAKSREMIKKLGIKIYLNGKEREV